MSKKNKKNTNETTTKRKGKKKWIIVAIAIFLIYVAANTQETLEKANNDAAQTVTATPSVEATAVVTKAPTAAPTEEATNTPSPTDAPTQVPTEAPTDTPAPTSTPTLKPTDAPTPTVEPTVDPVTLGYELLNGELLRATITNLNGRTIFVVKAKVDPYHKDKAFVADSYEDIVYLIEYQGCGEFDEIQYWAVMDASDGSETKVLSYTVDSDLIEKIANYDVSDRELGDYVTDLYILPSLNH